ncbi:MAG: hypothetical protein VXW06_02320, partial [Pseudomonadota bacterium]|nr:hypothetical protein [Pseudomonadota bacterium]
KKSIAWSNSTPERRQKTLAKHRDWFQKNREKHYASAKKWKENNPEIPAKDTKCQRMAAR